MNTFDRLWDNGPLYRQRPGVFPLSSDTAWLGAFVRLNGVKRFCDLGCGGGALSLQLLGRKMELQACGLDLIPEAVESTIENLRLNGWSGDYHTCDLRDWRSCFQPCSFDLVVTNPPYFPSGGTRAEGNRGIARSESCTLAELCNAASGLLQEGGRFCIVLPPTRLSELCCAMSAAGIEPKILQFVGKNRNTQPCALLAEGKKGGGTGIRFLPPILTAEET